MASVVTDSAAAGEDVAEPAQNAGAGTKNPREDREYMAGLARGLAVLQAFSTERPELSLSEIAEATGLNTAVVRRCLNTLTHLGYVECVDRQFRLRPEVANLAAPFIETQPRSRTPVPATIASPLTNASS